MARLDVLDLIIPAMVAVIIVIDSGKNVSSPQYRTVRPKERGSPLHIYNQFV
jgi:hypothetical protein